MKQILLDCLSKKSFLFHVSDNEAHFKHWFIEHAELFFSWANAPRRYLGGEPLMGRASKQILLPASPLPAPGTLPPIPFLGVPSSIPAPERQSNDQAPASNPSPNSESSPSPAPPAAHKNTSPGPQPTAQKPSPPDTVIVTRQPEKNHDDGRPREIIIAIVSTAVTTFALVAVLFLCCLKKRSNKIGPGDGQKDDRPLLNSLSAGMSLSVLFYNSHAIIFLFKRNINRLTFWNLIFRFFAAIYEFRRFWSQRSY